MKLKLTPVISNDELDVYIKRFAECEEIDIDDSLLAALNWRCIHLLEVEVFRAKSKLLGDVTQNPKYFTAVWTLNHTIDPYLFSKGIKCN